MILDILAILVGLLAIAQFFIKRINHWTTASKIVTFLLLAIISVLLWQCKGCANSVTDIDIDKRTSQEVIATPYNDSSPTPNVLSISMDDQTSASNSINMENPKPTATSVPTRAPDCRLCYANIVDSSGVDVTDSPYIVDSFGNEYREEVIFMRHYGNEFIIFSPLGEYSRFKGTAAIDENSSGTQSYMIEIFADDVSIYYLKIEKTDEPMQFDLDITDARLIKIVADGGVILGDGVFYNK